MRQCSLVGCTIALVFSGVLVDAQQQLPSTPPSKAAASLSTFFLEQGFEAGAVPPSSWSTASSNPTHPWQAVSAVSYPSSVYAGSWAAWVSADASSPSDEWLRSPIIDLSGVWDGTASFWALSDTLSCPSGGGATMLFHATNPANIALGLLWDMCIAESWPSLEYRQVTADLGAYHDQTIKIAWRYTGQNGQDFGLDDVVVTGTPAGPVLYPTGDWPAYAVPVITVHPEPTRAGEPTEVCAQLENLDSSASHSANIQFAWNSSTIGGGYTPINGPRPITVAAGGSDEVCIMWVPPISGSPFLQTTLSAGYEDLVAEHNFDYATSLQPSITSNRLFDVYNPTGNFATVTLGLVPHFAGWGLGLSQDVIPNLAPGATQSVTLTLIPPATLPIPGTPIVDVEAFIGSELIGGFRTVHYPPHIFADGFESGDTSHWSATSP